jgi:hypothetical protein
MDLVSNGDQSTLPLKVDIRRSAQTFVRHVPIDNIARLA